MLTWGVEITESVHGSINFFLLFSLRCHLKMELGGSLVKPFFFDLFRCHQLICIIGVCFVHLFQQLL